MTRRRSGAISLLTAGLLLAAVLQIPTALPAAAAAPTLTVAPTTLGNAYTVGQQYTRLNLSHPAIDCAEWVCCRSRSSDSA